VSESWVDVLGVDDIAPGGMRAVSAGGREVVLCRAGGDAGEPAWFALARRCGHMNAPLEMGTLDGRVLTCPLHHARFDVATGAPLAGPVPDYPGPEPLPPRAAAHRASAALVEAAIHTEPLRTYPVKVEAGRVWVAV
jgi:nitrite reductase/ring-hydroxylating ferredoxin subunit